MIKWKKVETYFEEDRHYLISKCGNYKIVNTGKTDGDGYCLLSKKGKYENFDCFCVQLSMGLYNHVKARAEVISKSKEVKI